MILGKALLKPSHPIIDVKNRMVLVWSAKSGCTFGVKWILHHMGLLEDAEHYSDWIHDYRIQVLMKDPAYFQALQLFTKDPLGFRVVRLVRNPFQRLVSSYIHAVYNGFEDAEIGAFLGRRLDRDQRFSFRELVAYLGSLNIHECDPHLKAQVHAIERFDLVHPGFIVHLEDSMQTLPELEAFLGLPPTDLEAFRHSRHHVPRSLDRSGGYLGDRLFMNRDIEQGVPDYHLFYDAELVEQVILLYQEDFLRYGYSTKLS